MALKHKCPPAGAPAWVLTYGDMMSLLLCFFVLLAAMANFDKKDKLFMAAMESIAKAFGAEGQVGFFPDKVIDFNSFLMKLNSKLIPTEMKNYGHSDEPGIDGRYYRVKKIRDGVELTIGGPIAFGRFSAELEPPMKEVLTKLADEVRGKTNKLEIRGHATNEPLPLESKYSDAFELGYARARNVADFLIGLGLDPRAFRISTAGAYEPIKEQAYNDARRAANRRVEIVVTQSLISDYLPKPETSSTPGVDVETAPRIDPNTEPSFEPAPTNP